MRFHLASAMAMILSVGETSPVVCADYDPLRVEQPQPGYQDLTIHDDARSRDIPIRVYLPATSGPAPVVLFSHGLGGSRQGSPYLGEHWARRGYVVVYLQHLGSDDRVWKDLPPAKRLAAMQKAAGLNNFLLRSKDVPVTLDQLDRWNVTEGHGLAGRLDLKNIGMSGHSFGAVTTQAASGQTYPLGGKFTDQRIKAAVAMSPSAPRQGDPKQSFASVSIPWMLLTGTNDKAVIGDADPQSRLAVFPALPPGDKYELVLDKAEHSAFSDRALPGDMQPRNPNHHRAILALTTAFWDAYLRRDVDAKAWLNGEEPRKVLEANDRWQHK
jgi:predicted dienelactone hydrolase